mmetsp:Transcript_119869/g.372674  ORF Transcript_119869/g.372674 Transcript_119869/m.372674 type:complete len:234 (-) Transcript_119869:1818-2519(-)
MHCCGCSLLDLVGRQLLRRGRRILHRLGGGLQLLQCPAPASGRRHRSRSDRGGPLWHPAARLGRSGHRRPCQSVTALAEHWRWPEQPPGHLSRCGWGGPLLAGCLRGWRAHGHPGQLPGCLRCNGRAEGPAKRLGRRGPGCPRPLLARLALHRCQWPHCMRARLQRRSCERPQGLLARLARDRRGRPPALLHGFRRSCCRRHRQGLRAPLPGQLRCRPRRSDAELERPRQECP